MAKVSDPSTISSAFSIGAEKLSDLGVLNSSLAVDTKLFIDPLLLVHSEHSEIHGKAATDYRKHFEAVITFLRKTNSENDVAWRTAKKLLTFHEISATCLGYGAGISGSGFGTSLSAHLLQTAKEIVELGVYDPDLFVAMALFESDIGPDRISDMTTNVILEGLIQFNKRIIDELALTPKNLKVLNTEFCLLENPVQPEGTPLIMVPTDILRDLPIAKDWDDIDSVCTKNQDLRNRLNNNIAHIWASKTKRDKKVLKQQAMGSSEAFETLVDAVREVGKVQSKIAKDVSGLVSWAESADLFTKQYPLENIATKKHGTIDFIHEAVSLIVEQFTHLIENW